MIDYSRLFICVYREMRNRISREKIQKKEMDLNKK
jgi:hypothetical protein